MNYQECRDRLSRMLAQRGRREAAWRELSAWICPWRGRFSGNGNDEFEAYGIERFTHAAAQAALAGASGMTSGMTPRNTPWFRPAFTDTGMSEISGARQWLDALDLRLQEALANGGFYQAIQKFNLDLIWSGCALLYVEKAEPVRFEAVQVGSFCLVTALDGSLEAVARQYVINAGEAARIFDRGRLLPDTVRKARRSPWQEVPVWQMCWREESGVFPVRSVWFEDGGREFLKESGYYEMPFFHAVWNEGSTPYGTGPGDMCIADARQIDALERNKLAGLGKLVDPPVQCPPQFKEIIDLEPGGLNYSDDPGSIIRPILDLSPYASSLARVQEEIAIVRQRLEDGLMASIFRSMPLEQRPAGMSATEFLERKREALQQLGPVISAYEPTVLTPLLFRTASILDRAGLTPPVPKALEGYPLYMKMEFISPMANALRQTGAETSRALFQDIAGMYQATRRADLFDKLDMDQMIDELATGLGVPGSIIRPDTDVAQIRQQREQQAQQAMMLQMALAQQQQPQQDMGGQDNV